MNQKDPVSLNLNVRGLGVSATLAIKERCRRLRADGRHVFDFGLGQSPFPVPSPVVEALRTHAAEKDYLPVAGLPALREAVASFHHKHDHVEIRSDHVLVGPGSKELMFLLQTVYYGEILVATPCWVSYMPQAQMIGRRVSRIHTRSEDQWRLSRATLGRAIEVVQDDSRPRILVLNYPDNPTGLSYTAQQLQEIAEVCRKYRIVVLSDEIYGQLHHEGEHVSIGKYYPEGTIISSGLSKWCGAGGWRLGTFAFPEKLEWLMDAMAAAASETYTSVCAPIQYAAVRAFEGCVDIERYLWHTRRVLSALATRIVPTLREAGIAVNAPVGAFYLFLDFSGLAAPLATRGVSNGAALCARLLEETGVAVLPGSAFGRARGELTARLAYVDFDGAAALAASEHVGLDQPLPASFLEHYCENVVRGAERIAEWAREAACGSK